MCIWTDLKVLYWNPHLFIVLNFSVFFNKVPSCWTFPFSLEEYVVFHKGCYNSYVSQMSQQVHIFFTSSFLPVCMHVYAAGDRPFSQKTFIHCFVCSLTSSTVLGAAGALGHICLLRRGHHRHRHPTGRLLSSREEDSKIDALTEFCLQFLHLVTVFPLCISTNKQLIHS